jgi:cytochrome P450
MKFAEWSDKYGPIYQQTMMGRMFCGSGLRPLADKFWPGVLHIWVSKEHMVLDILAKQGSICSDRPAAFPNVPGTKDWKYLPLQGFHDTWRRQRKFTNLIFGTAHENNYYGHQTLEVPRTLVRMLQAPERWSTYLDQHQARFLSRCAFGTPEHASALCTNAWRLLINISPSGRFSNVLPGCMKVPKCIAWWRVDEQDRQDKETKLYENCQNEVREQWKEGKAPPSFTRTYLDQGERFGFPSDIEAAFNVGMVSMAGIHTTSSPLHTFFLAMTLHPEWMERLQKDIDALCGDRMPVLSDIPDLPIMRAIVKEGLRWRPAVPTGMSLLPVHLISSD